MTITISNGVPGTQNVITYTKAFTDSTYEEYCTMDGTVCSVTHAVTREMLAWMVRRCRESGLVVKFWKDFT